MQAPFLEFSENFIDLLRISSTKDFNKRAIAYFKYEEINEPLVTALENLKDIRDKLLAHNEDISVSTLIHYDSIELLLKHAQSVVSFFSLAYCGMHLKVSDRFYVSSMAGNWQNTFKRFLKQRAGDR